MSFPIPIYGIIAPTGVMLRARLRNPDGTTASDVALVEDGPGLGTYSAVGTLTVVTDTSGLPYTVEVRQVAAQTSGGFDASTTVRAARQPIGWNGPLAGQFASDPYGVNVTAVGGGVAALDTGGGAGGTGTGSGDFALDHNGGAGVTVDGVAASADCMRFTRSGEGVDNVEVAAFLKANYDAGIRGALDRAGTTYTGSDGRWQAPLMLDDGTYTLVASKGGFLVDSMTVVVP